MNSHEGLSRARTVEISRGNKPKVCILCDLLKVASLLRTEKFVI